MITTEALAAEISRGNGETARQSQDRIARTAAALGLTAVDGSWHDDDADEIALTIAR